MNKIKDILDETLYIYDGSIFGKELSIQKIEELMKKNILCEKELLQCINEFFKSEFSTSYINSNNFYTFRERLSNAISKTQKIKNKLFDK